MSDLFGEKVILLKGLDKKGNIRGGYAAKPGSGPKNETCSSCAHYQGRGIKYKKCELMRKWWTNGPGTDIRAGSPACAKWESLRYVK